MFPSSLLLLLLTDIYSLFPSEYPPDITLPDQNGSFTSFSDLTSSKSNGSIVVFYVPDITSKSTNRQFKALQKVLPSFSSIQSKVVLVTPSSVPENFNISSYYNINCPILSDSNGSLAKAWSIPKSLRKTIKRTTYIFTSDGYLSMIYKRAIYVSLHVLNAYKRAKLLFHPYNSYDNSTWTHFSSPDEESEILHSILHSSFDGRG